MWERSFEKAVEVTRGGLIESVHAAAVAIANPAGDLAARLGEPDLVVLLRSAAKPFQAASVVASGAAERFGLTSRELALMAGSHAGDGEHAATAASILEKAAMDPAALQCGIHLPLSKRAAERLARDGLAPSALTNNCSGKHAGMLIAARAGGHTIETYLDPGHPVQLANLDSISRFTGGETRGIRVAVDGCSAPTFAVSLREAARAYARLIAALDGPDGDDPLSRGLAAVARAMRAHPEMVAGDGMLDTELMRSVPGLVSKIGADGIHTMGWLGPGGPLGVALKVMDGDVGRARTAIVLKVLRDIGALEDASPLPEEITAELTVRNHRRLEVGEVRAVFKLGPAVPAPRTPEEESRGDGQSAAILS